MASNQFGRAPVTPRQQRISPETLKNASLMTGRLPVVPSKESLGRGGNVPPALARTIGNSNQRFFSKSQPVAPAFKPFNEQVAQTQKMIENSRAQMQAGSGVSARGSKLPGAVLPQNGRGDAMKSFPNNSATTGGRSSVAPTGRLQSPAPPQSAPRPGWHSFGPSGGSQTQSGLQGRASDRQPVTPAQRGFDQKSGTAPATPRTIDSSRPGWHSFTPPSGGSHLDRTPAQPRQSGSGGQNPSRTFSAPTRQNNAPTAPARSNNWHQFTPPSSGSHLDRAPAQPRQSQSQSQSQPRGNAPAARDGWHQFTPPSRGYSAPSDSRSSWGGYSGRGNSNSSYDRRSLDLRQPVATPRSQSYDRGYSAPQRGNYGGSYSRPSGGGYSRPSDGGGYRGGGGGGYSRPSGGGGYRGGGGDSRPSGGGGGSHGSSHPSGGKPHGR